MPKYRSILSINLIVIFIGATLSISSCKSADTGKKTIPDRSFAYVKRVALADGLSKIRSNNTQEEKREYVLELIRDARKYLGAPYVYGGNTSKGMDCSGLMCLIFSENDIKLPRRSIEQFENGKPLKNSEIKVGDMVFFAPGGGKTVSHVGLVHHIAPDGEINFLHTSSSKGVIISSLNEKYWNKAYLGAKRYITKK